MVNVMLIVGCNKTSGNTSDNNESSFSDSSESKYIGKYYSNENILEYQRLYNEDFNVKFSDAQLKEIQAWVDYHAPEVVRETDKMVEAVHEYNMEKYGNKYTECSWEPDFRPYKLPQVISWAENLMSIDGVNFITMLYILNDNKQVDLYDDSFKYKSKENYYLHCIFALAESSLGIEKGLYIMLCNGILCLQSGEYTISQVKQMDDRIREFEEMYEN